MILEGKGLKLSSSFYFADLKLKSSFKQQIFADLRLSRGLNHVPLNYFPQTFQFCKAGKDCF